MISVAAPYSPCPSQYRNAGNLKTPFAEKTKGPIVTAETVIAGCGFRTCGKLIPDDYQKPAPKLRAVT
jgi:hypothetical protein